MSTHWMHVLAVLALQHLWQSAALLLLVWLVLWLGKRLDAQARSWVWLCAFALAAVLPLAVLLPGQAVAPPVSVAMPAENATPVAGAPSPVLPNTSAQHALASTPLSPVWSWSTRLGILALAAWLVGLMWNLVRLFAGWRMARRLRDAAVRLSATDYLLPRSFPVSVPVLVSDDIASPMLVGLRRPCILLPRTLLDELPEATVLHVLRHELAHVRRGDMWAALAQALCLAVYWWNPLLWLMRAQLHMAREMACDEQAVQRCANPSGVIDYANALLASAQRLLGPGRSQRAFAAGMFDTRAALTQRIEGLLDMNMHKRISGPRPVLIACLAVALASGSMTLLATPRLGPAWAPAAATTTGTEHAGDGALLISAVTHNRADVLRTLVASGVDIDARKIGDGTALIVAAKRGDVAIVKQLIGIGAKVDRSSPGDGNPLIAAAANGHLDVAELLVDARADVNAIVVGDETPLINAARQGHLAIVKYLVKHGADVNLGMTADFGQWRSPLNQARGAAIRDYLVSKGAIPHQRKL